MSTPEEPLRSAPEDPNKLALRLTRILFRLNQRGWVDPQALAAEFEVSLRTIQRDLNERFDFLELERVEGRYRVAPEKLARLTEADLERFACLAGVRELFPDLGTDALLARLNDHQTSVLVHGHHHEDLDNKAALFSQLEFAILGGHRVSFRYRKEDAAKVYGPVDPYKLVNHAGVWYLAGQHGGQLKSFSLGKMEGLLIDTEDCFSHDPALLQQLANEDSIWLKPVKTEVRLKVAKAAAGYFQRRQLVPAQVIEQVCEDGSLVVRCRVANEHQILPIVRYWMPHVQVLEPAAFCERLRQEVQGFLCLLDEAAAPGAQAHHEPPQPA